MPAYISSYSIYVHVYLDTWYCSDECALGEEAFDDGVLQYTLEMLWKGINLLVRRDLVRAGDGLHMLTMWKLDMLQFWKNHHTRYLRLGHRLLACMFVHFKNVCDIIL